MQPANPLFPNSDSKAEDTGFVLHRGEPTVAKPLEPTNAALNLIREKLAAIYAEAPDTKTEEQQAAAARPRSKHQQFMYDLQSSGKSLADIQSSWHAYYAALPDDEKHDVWREFYQASGHTYQSAVPQQPAGPTAAATVPTPPAAPYQTPRTTTSSLSQSFTTWNAAPGNTVAALPKIPRPSLPAKSFGEIRQGILRKVSGGGKLKLRHHLQSLSFGLAIGFVTLVIALFGLFNEIIIAPFIQPGRAVGATPIIIDPNAASASSTPEVIIPKLNLEIPLDFSQTQVDEDAFQLALQDGVVHYPGTANPGENGNASFFGHSSSNILNPGKYKFAFVLLHELVPGDTFYLTYHGQTYIYKVFLREVVDPSDVGVLNPIDGHPATATLITCDPPGTALKRLIVTGDQISPAPGANTAGDQQTIATAASAAPLPDNGPSLLQRIWDSIF